MRSRVEIVIGVVCVVLAVGLGAVALLGFGSGKTSNAYVSPPPPAPELRSVVTARREIHRGVRIAADMLSSLRIGDARPQAAFEKPAEVVGGVALDDIRPGQMLLRDDVLLDASARPGLSVLVPPGKRAVALRVNDEVAVGNFVRPDDKVDIELVIPADQLARVRGEDVREAGTSESRLLLQNIVVLSVGETLTIENDNRAVRMQNLTVAVTPQEGLLIALAKQLGSFYLALRHPTDEANVQGGLYRSNDVLGPMRERSAERPSAEAGKRILVIMGSRETHQVVR
jgi:pilus assembly protein CpaB